MAKKSFKGGLGSLLESSFNKAGLDKNDLSSSSTDKEIEALKKELEICKAELALWRQGLLDKTLFEESLLEEGLRYNSETNSVENVE